MKILVIGDDQSFRECKEKFGEQHEYILTDSHIQARKDFSQASVIFDFILEEDPSQFQLLTGCPVPAFISAVKSTLAEMVSTTQGSSLVVFGFNGLPTFVHRPTLEVCLFNKGHDGQLRDICKQLGTAYEVVDDIAGMITPRIVCMIINEAYCAIEDGTATAGDIDIAMKLGTNYPLGPVEWSKKIGLRNVVDVLDAARRHSGSERYRVCELLREEASRE
jgi:3-hydroxybutyryl-CoA dehydrogenase